MDTVTGTARAGVTPHGRMAGDVVPSLRERLLAWMLEQPDRVVTTRHIAEGALKIPADHVRQRMHPLVLSGDVIAPARGLWVAVRPEEKAWGGPSPLTYLDDWMTVAKRAYYVGWLSAARLYGATNQVPMTVQVAVGSDYEDRRVSGVRTKFHTRSGVARRGQCEQRRYGEAQVMVSTAEATALDVATDLDLVGGVDNAVTVVVDLALEVALDVDQLIKVAAHYPAATRRRLGWALQRYQDDHDFDDLDQLARSSGWVGESPTVSLLDPGEPRRGPVDPRWRLQLNTDVDPDL